MSFFKKLFLGTKAADNITGSPKSDVIVGKGGADTLNGVNGNDLILGGSGDDLLKGGAGHDFLFGMRGNDTINGGTSGDLLVGGSGNDRLTGGGGKDFMWGGSGADTFRIDATGFKNTILDFNFAAGDRIDIPAGYTLADAKIVDNGLKLFGVTLTFSKAGEAGPTVAILGVDKVADVSADWFI